MRKLLGLMAIAGLAAAGCGSSSPRASDTTTTAAPAATAPTGTTLPATAWVGIGTPLTQFATKYPRTTRGCSQGQCYGPDVNSSLQAAEFLVSTDSGLVDGYTEALPEGTLPAAARAAILAMVPSDIVVTLDQTEHDSSGNSCHLINVQSKTLAGLLSSPKIGDAQGVVGISMTEVNTDGSMSYGSKVDSATVSVAPEDPGNNC
jgi:hypothetical protein